MKVLRLLLGDQLNIEHSWFKSVDQKVTYAMFEMRQEIDYVTHHVQKLCGFLLAMRQFAKELENRGHQIVYYKIDDIRNSHQLDHNLEFLIQNMEITHFEYQLPDEYRLDEQLKIFCRQLDISFKNVDTEHFYTSRNELTEFFRGKKQLIMESFYRYMRKKHQLLMLGDQPEGGQWNFDKSNRKKWKGTPAIPQAIFFENDIETIVDAIEKLKINTIGTLSENRLDFPVTRNQALQQLKYFCNHLLLYFGDYQDALHTEELNLFHSRLSFALNCKLIAPKEVLHEVIHYYRLNQEKIHISQVEGFVRQIIGWREYMRGIYWKEMPEYASKNELQNHHKLPKFYWNGKTKMNCLKQCIENSLDHAYAHHIQRLMITGNFALLLQVNPDEVDFWYLGIYMDAIEWVQLTNTRGMSQYADGGLLATKPYVSSASYIHKMSNYCVKCNYDRSKRVGENACPFNSLYWNFLDDKRSFLSKNRRMGMMYNLLNKIPGEELSEIKKRAYQIIENPDAY